MRVPAETFKSAGLQETGVDGDFHEVRITVNDLRLAVDGWGVKNRLFGDLWKTFCLISGAGVLRLVFLRHGRRWRPGNVLHTE